MAGPGVDARVACARRWPGPAAPPTPADRCTGPVPGSPARAGSRCRHDPRRLPRPDPPAAPGNRAGSLRGRRGPGHGKPQSSAARTAASRPPGRRSCSRRASWRTRASGCAAARASAAASGSRPRRSYSTSMFRCTTSARPRAATRAPARCRAAARSAGPAASDAWCGPPRRRARRAAPRRTRMGSSGSSRSRLSKSTGSRSNNSRTVSGRVSRATSARLASVASPASDAASASSVGICPSAIARSTARVIIGPVSPLSRLIWSIRTGSGLCSAVTAPASDWAEVDVVASCWSSLP